MLSIWGGLIGLFVDIHAHILPGIDDGAKDMETAVQMLKIACRNGTGHIIATPHYIPGETQYHPSLVTELCSKLNMEAEKEAIPCTVYPGSEIFISPDLPRLYADNQVITLNHSSYLLIEMPMAGIPTYTDSVLYELQLMGVTPIIAHPERNQDIIEEPVIIKKLVERGILTQINAGSVTGLYGKKVQKTALKLIKQGLVHFIASDAHTTHTRTPDLSMAIHVLRKKMRRMSLDGLLLNNGLNVIHNKKIEGDGIPDA